MIPTMVVISILTASMMATRFPTFFPIRFCATFLRMPLPRAIAAISLGVLTSGLIMGVASYGILEAVGIFVSYLFPDPLLFLCVHLKNTPY